MASFTAVVKSKLPTCYLKLFERVTDVLRLMEDGYFRLIVSYNILRLVGWLVVFWLVTEQVRLAFSSAIFIVGIREFPQLPFKPSFDYGCLPTRD